MKKNLLFGLIGIFLIFSFALTGCPTTNSGTDTETSVIKVTNVPEGTAKIFVSVYDNFDTKTTLAYGEAAVSGGAGTLSLLTPGGGAWASTDTVAIAALADRTTGKQWDSVELGETIHTLDWAAGTALEGDLLEAVKSDAQTLSPIDKKNDPTLYELDDLPFETGSVLKYYSLSTGTEVDASKAATTEWDIAIEKHASALLMIYTNSGSSASGAGDAKVWFTNKTDFDDVKLSDRVTDFSGANAEYAPYTKDVSRYLKFGMGTGTQYQVNMNIMTYFGFNAGTKDGLLESTTFTSTAVSPDYKYFDFDKKAFWSQLGMPPVYSPTNQVYIIRHAGGAGFSKLQVGVAWASGGKWAVSLKFIEVEAE
ncbi:MAG: HmuY family protein [Treponema sp.]|jgi:hypothetical protein|nr:HmuY family protein [Treponema sp.]